MVRLAGLAFLLFVPAFTLALPLHFLEARAPTKVESQSKSPPPKAQNSLKLQSTMQWASSTARKGAKTVGKGVKWFGQGLAPLATSPVKGAHVQAYELQQHRSKLQGAAEGLAEVGYLAGPAAPHVEAAAAICSALATALECVNIPRPKFMGPRRKGTSEDQSGSQQKSTNEKHIDTLKAVENNGSESTDAKPGKAKKHKTI